MSTRTTMDARNLNAKYESFTKTSGEVTAGLRKLPGGARLYEEAQASERTLRLAQQTWEAQEEALTSARTRRDSVRKQLVAFCRALVVVTEAAGLSGASAVVTMDTQDEAAMATNIADIARQVPRAGASLAQVLDVLRADWLAADATVATATTTWEGATRTFGEAYYRATAVIAQAKALLMASGISVLDRKPPRRKAARARAEATTAPAFPAPPQPLAA